MLCMCMCLSISTFIVSFVCHRGACHNTIIIKRNHNYNDNDSNDYCIYHDVHYLISISIISIIIISSML